MDLPSEEDDDSCVISDHVSAPETPIERPIPDEIMQIPKEEETSCAMESSPVETSAMVNEILEPVNNDVEDASKVDMFVPRRSTRIPRRPKYLEDYKQ